MLTISPASLDLRRRHGPPAPRPVPRSQLDEILVLWRAYPEPVIFLNPDQPPAAPPDEEEPSLLILDGRVRAAVDTAQLLHRAAVALVTGRRWRRRWTDSRPPSEVPLADRVRACEAGCRHHAEALRRDLVRLPEFYRLSLPQLDRQRDAWITLLAAEANCNPNGLVREFEGHLGKRARPGASELEMLLVRCLLVGMLRGMFYQHLGKRAAAHADRDTGLVVEIVRRSRQRIQQDERLLHQHQETFPTRVDWGKVDLSAPKRKSPPRGPGPCSKAK